MILDRHGQADLAARAAWTAAQPHAARDPAATPEDERDAALYYLLARHPGRALVFVNAVSSVRRLAAVLKLLGLPAVALHAQQQQRQRLKVRRLGGARGAHPGVTARPCL
jgi:hypothetical protein